MNAMSAISTRGRMRFMVFTESFTAEVMCRFLGRLAGQLDHRVQLVADGHSAHRSKKVRDWLMPTPTTSGCTSLLPYSPELNPDKLSTPTSNTACTSSTEPRTRPNSPQRPAVSSADANVSHTSSAATSTAHTSTTPWTRTP
ncbi:transposase [Streptomyces sp. NPDC001273]|uniref:transposase n=1 Tax=Streptomyces sp. NPDC007056 TaxID=3155358 RepID=UPI00340A1E6B